MHAVPLLSCAVLVAGLASLDATRVVAPGFKNSLLVDNKGALTFIAPDEGTQALDDDDSYWASIQGAPYDPNNAPLNAQFHFWDGWRASSYFAGQHDNAGTNKSAYYDMEGFPTTRWWHVTTGVSKSWFKRDPWW